MTIDPDKYYGISSLAKLFDIDRRTIRDNLEDKKKNGLPYYRVGDREQYRILGRDVKNFWGSASIVRQEMQPSSTTSGVPPGNKTPGELQGMKVEDTSGVPTPEQFAKAQSK